MNTRKNANWALLGFLALGSDQGKDPAAEGRRLRLADEASRQAFVSACAAQGIQLDFSKKTLSIPALVQEADMPIEYLLVGPRGATHETLLICETKPSVLVAALYSLGLEPGTNVQYQDRVPAPTPAELAEGALHYDVIPPEGPGVYLHVAWKEGTETRRYRAEDLILNTKTGKTARRVQWVFLGSRWLRSSKDAEPAFAADLEENLVSVCYFASGNQVFTNPDPDAQEQHLFVPNAWLLPKKGETVTLEFSLEKGDFAGEGKR